MGFHYNVMFSCSNLFLSDSRFLKNGNSKRVQKFHHISFLEFFFFGQSYLLSVVIPLKGGGGYKPLFKGCFHKESSVKISLGLKSRIAYRRSVHCLNLLLKSRFGHHEEFSSTYQVVVSRLDS